MNKQEIIDAINATIAPNNIKGITADSLRNLLIMMVENAGEGGSGSGGNIVFYLGMPSETMDGPTILTPEQQAHNAQMYAALDQLPVVPVVGLDMSYMMSQEYGMIIPVTMTCMGVVYISNDSAQQMGEESGMVQLSLEGMDVIIAADGSVMLIPAE